MCPPDNDRPGLGHANDVPKVSAFVKVLLRQAGGSLGAVGSEISGPHSRWLLRHEEPVQRTALPELYLQNFPKTFVHQ